MVPRDRAYLELRHVEKSYRSGVVATPVLRDLSVAFSKGSFSALLGPSGCGKSTLLALAGALDKPDSGSIVVARRDGDLDLATADEGALSAYRRETVGFVFQAFNLLRSLSVVENVEAAIEFSPLRAGDRRRAAMESLDRVGVADLAAKLPHQISGGQQQRVAIARAIVRRPEIILADEPTGNLDRDSGARVFECLRDLQRSLEVTLIMVTHDAKLAACADRVVHMRDGRVHETG